MKDAVLTITMLLVFLLIPIAVISAQPLILSGSTGLYRLGGANLDILEDKTGKLTVADVTSHRHASLFRQSSQKVPGFGLGFTHLVMYFSGIENIGNVIPVPQTSSHCEL